MKKNALRLSIHSKKLSNQLFQLGCVYAKSLVLKFPQYLPENLVTYFIRGYFEGDGSISYYNNSNSKRRGYDLSIISSVDFIDGLVSFLEIKLGVRFNIQIKNKNKLLRCGGRIKIKKFFDWLYKDRLDLILPRKYNKFVEILNF